MPRTLITYLFDPLCGWCYGASPRIARLAADDRFQVDPQPVGLFSGDGAFAMNADFARHAWGADQRIAKLSGQPFSQDYRIKVLEAATGMVDSMPATLALTAIRQTAPERVLGALQAIQHARYVEGLDNGDPAVIADILDRQGLPQIAERVRTGDDALRASCLAGLEIGRAEMRRFNLRGVPALLAGDAPSRRALDGSLLFGPYETLATEALAGAGR